MLGMQTIAYGFPRLGSERQFKRAVESFWKTDGGAQDEKKLLASLGDIQQWMKDRYAETVDLFPSGEMTLYDPMLDTAIAVGLYRPKNLSEYYALCRGGNALEMTKWFNTNYHYLVPEFHDTEPSALVPDTEAFFRFGDKGGMPSLIGPFTFLKLAKGVRKELFPEFLRTIAATYRDALKGRSAAIIQEPALVFELSPDELALLSMAYEIIAASGCAINLMVYYDSVDYLSELYKLPVAGIGLDLVHGSENVDEIESLSFPQDKLLIVGLVDGRDVWRTNIEEAVSILKRLSAKVENLAVSNAAPLFHLPVTLEGESLDPALTERLAFAREKLKDIETIAGCFEGKIAVPEWHAAPIGRNEKVRSRVAGLVPEDFDRSVEYHKRAQIQEQRFDLPLFPTTTIGSFPQTTEIRKARANFRKGTMGEKQYRAFVEGTIADVVERQEKLDLDVLVHGEAERTDMVEFFAEKLEGIAFTQKGWIISYGTRGYRPPIIFGDISRPKAMTTREIAYAQSLTKRPVKGMLTGPVTIIAWSFVRQDIPIHEVAYQIGLALQDEVADYEEAGIGMVQIDEPAFRELAPNKRRKWNDYFDWAIDAFRLCGAKAKPETQIHSHMCYSEFNEIIDQIEKMDFDVISIEATRSRGDVMESFEERSFDRQIGIGVYDIHSPVVPAKEDIARVIERAIKVIPKEKFWINPDCGLKTRGWEETTESLKNMVAVAKEFRRRHGG